MNCKPGDLAVVVRDSLGHHLGAIVVCIRAVPATSVLGGMAWETEPSLRDPDGMFFTPNDKCLRPIRPGDITDEEVRDLYAPSDERVTCHA